MKVWNRAWIVGALLGVGSVIAPAGVAKQAASDRLPQLQTPSSVANPAKSSPLDRDDEPNPMRDRMEAQAAKARNSDRFKRLTADTDKLLKLSTELKEDVDKTTKNEMSLDVIRKAAEIEKLAHDVKERMKG